MAAALLSLFILLLLALFFQLIVSSAADLDLCSGAVAMAAIKRQPAMRFSRWEYLLNGRSCRPRLTSAKKKLLLGVVLSMNKVERDHNSNLLLGYSETSLIKLLGVHSQNIILTSLLMLLTFKLG